MGGVARASGAPSGAIQQVCRAEVEFHLKWIDLDSARTWLVIVEFAGHYLALPAGGIRNNLWQRAARVARGGQIPLKLFPAKL